MLRLLGAGPHIDDRLLAGIEKRALAGEPLYASLLHALTHLELTERQARRHWHKVVEHRQELHTQLGRDVGLRVALLDYFVNVTGELKNPKVIEVATFERTERRALTDGLTGLFNRHFFVKALHREVLRARRHALKLSLALFDLDDFKRINDVHGHPAGDRVLVRVASLVSASLREFDISARYGGEEFAVMLPDTDREGAYVVAERIRERVERYRRGRDRGVTISGGVVTFPDDALDVVQLVKEADRLLYRAKAEGKNKIALSDPHRRRFERHALKHPVEVAVAPRRIIEGVTRNVSQGGLLITAPESVDVGARVSVMLQPADAPSLTLRAQVVRSEALEGDGSPYDLAVRLLSEPRRNRALAALWGDERPAAATARQRP